MNLDLEKIKMECRMRAPDDGGSGCFPCKLIADDIEKNGKLTDHPVYGEVRVFPIAGKMKHLELEGIIGHDDCDLCREKSA